MQYQLVGMQKLCAWAGDLTLVPTNHLVKLSLPNILNCHFFQKLSTEDFKFDRLEASPGVEEYDKVSLLNSSNLLVKMEPRTMLQCIYFSAAKTESWY